MKKTTIILVGVSLLVVGSVAAVFLAREKEGKPIASIQRFVLSEQPKALTEDLAVSYARQALAQDGLNTNVWQPVHDGRLTAWGRPIGSFAVANTNNSNHVCIAFRSAPPPIRVVSVYLFEGSLICQSSSEE